MMECNGRIDPFPSTTPVGYNVALSPFKRHYAWKSVLDLFICYTVCIISDSNAVLEHLKHRILKDSLRLSIQ